MVKVYSAALVIGLIGLITFIFRGALADGMGRQDRDPGPLLGRRSKLATGGIVGFGMGGISAEFSPLDLTWPVALAIALGAALVSVAWVAYATRLASGDR